MIALVTVTGAVHPGRTGRRRRAAVHGVRGPGGRVWRRSWRTSPAHSWPGTVLAAGAVISIFSVTLVVIYGQTRILFAMARDGMIPELFHRVNPRTRTPSPNTIIVAAVIAILAGFIPINFLAEMTSVGTLVAFLVVSIAVMVLRRRATRTAADVQGAGLPGDARCWRCSAACGSSRTCGW